MIFLGVVFEKLIEIGKEILIFIFDERETGRVCCFPGSNTRVTLLQIEIENS